MVCEYLVTTESKGGDTVNQVFLKGTPVVDAIKTTVCKYPFVSESRGGGMTIGQPWYEVAAERIRAGESETDVLADYGYEKVDNDRFWSVSSEDRDTPNQLTGEQVKKILDVADKITEEYSKKLNESG